ncbi:DNA replication/repair protein RecF [candidate division KSB1 bacterium]|nr:DNA replication/repair protein RecF [candidate division KSB1 bacterium]
MILSSLELKNFRNYVHERIEFNTEQNIISGRNAQGKTNLLEAIYLLCITRSFRTRIEKELCNFESDECTLKGEFVLGNGNKRTIIFYYQKKDGKQFSVNKKKVEKFSSHIGQFPVVISSPEAYNLTTGPPAERRKFIDIMLSQINIQYMYQLQEYYRILKQRNSILGNRRYSSNQITKLLEPWNLGLVEKGSQIILERMSFVEEFKNILRNIYSQISTTEEELNFTYGSKIQGKTLEEIKNRYDALLESSKRAEMEQGTTTIGPHRDDLVFEVNENNLRKFGSRGQHKTVLISLMISEFELIKNKLNETPVILVDDLYSEIDPKREERIMEFLLQLGQLFITTTNEISSLKDKRINRTAKYFQIESGKIRYVK